MTVSARGVHAVLAAGVARPELVDAWQVRPEALRAHGVDPGSIDLAAVKLFAGFTTKVRHNGVRTLLPMSFRLMAEAGFEIELFAWYASFAATHHEGYAGTIEERAARFVAFAEGWLDPSLREHALLWDLLRHEHALSVLGRTPADESERPARSAAADAPAAGTGGEIGPASVLRACGEMLRYEMRSDPVFVAGELARRSAGWRHVVCGTRYLAYQRLPGAGVRTAELDAFGYYALAFADGRRTAREISVLLGADDATPAFLRGLEQLAEAHLLELADAA